jgi:uncharacterized caspase-like protein
MTSFPERARVARAGLAAGVALLFSCAAAVAQAENYALIVGINAYPNATADVRTLTFAEKDASDLQAALLGRGFKQDNVVVLPGDRARKTDILRVLRQFARDPDIDSDDQFVVFFSGHGLLDTVTGKTFWMAHDTSVAMIEDSGIRLEHLMDYVHDIKAGRKLVLLDHCHSGQIVNRRRDPTSGGLTAASASTLTTGRDSETVTAVEKGPVPLRSIQDTLSSRASGLAVLAAAYDTAFETSKYTNGVFTKALLEALDSLAADKNADGKLSLDELKLHVVSRVPDLARQAQREQFVADEISGAGTADWLVVSSLPVGNLQAAKAERDAAAHLLNTWEFNQWISPESKRDCKNAYTAQVSGLENSTPLPETTTRLLRACRNYLAGSAPTDRQKAEELDDLLGTVRRGSP